MDASRLPSRMRERASRVARGESAWTVPVPRDAATVCLLRDGTDGLEVFLMRRTTSMAFAAGMHVYPGGAVEASDSRVPVAGRADLDARRGADVERRPDRRCSSRPRARRSRSAASCSPSTPTA